jgi:uncharacterized Zn finger protein
MLNLSFILESHPYARTTVGAPMPDYPCPKCAYTDAERLKIDAWVTYWRCWDCGHVWTTSKDEPDQPARDVTVSDRPQRVKTLIA